MSDNTPLRSATLRAAEIEMPFPQMDLRVRSLFGRDNDDALRALGLKLEPGAVRAAEFSSTNDAADELMKATLQSDQEDDNERMQGISEDFKAR